VLLALVDIDPSDRPIREPASAIAARSSLTAGTVTRFLYELADRGVIERVRLSSPVTTAGGNPARSNRGPPTIAFRSLTTVSLDDAP